MEEVGMGNCNRFLVRPKAIPLILNHASQLEPFGMTGLNQSNPRITRQSGIEKMA
jgi:hypothetical protein